MEDKEPFSDKNLLILIAGDHHCFNRISRDCKKYFKRTHLINFVGHSRQHGLSDTERHIREYIQRNDIQLVLALQLATNFELSVEYYASLRKLTKLVFWFFDDDMYFDATSKYYAQAADAVITCDYFPSIAYKKLEIPAIYSTPPQDLEVYHPIPSAKDIDVCFVGDCTKCNRMEYLDFLISNGVKVETYGHGSKNGFLPEEEQISAIYSRTKIVLTFSKLDRLAWPIADDPLLNRVRQNKAHFPQIALTRSFCLSEYSPTLHMIANIGVELDVFDNKNDLLSKVRYYLAHEKEREEMADRAYKTARSAFSDTNLFSAIMAQLQEVLGGRRHNTPYADTIELSSAFKATVVAGLTISLFTLLKSGKLLNAGKLFIRLFRYGPGPFLSGFPTGMIRSLTVLFHKLAGNYSRVYKKPGS